MVFSKHLYGTRPYQPYFGFGDFCTVAKQQELEERGLLPRGYRYQGGHFFWEPTAECTAATVGDFLYEHYLSRYRAEDVELVDPARRVFVLGGSLAVGSSATNPERSWHALLERTLARQFPPRAPRIFNCAMGAFISTQELLALVLAVLPRRPNAVIFLNGLNDIAQPWTHGTRPGDPYNLSTVLKYWYERPFVHGRADPQAERSLERRTAAVLQNAEARTLVQRSIANVYVQNMSRCIDLCRAADVKVAVCFQPWLEMSRRRLGLSVTEGGFAVGVAAAVEETFELIRQQMTDLHSDAFYDLTGLIEHRDQLGRFSDPFHLDDNGQALLGEAVAKVVEAWF